MDIEQVRQAMIAALQQCEEYFDNRADADCDQDGFIPNEEMRLLTEIRAILDVVSPILPKKDAA